MPAAAVTSAHLWFDAGAVDETDREAGAAHFVEHLLFKGTQRRGIGRAAAEIEGLGGDLNAWTSWDETVLHATLASSGVEEPLDVLFDMASASTFDPVEVDRERKVVLEEMRGYEADPDTIALEHLQARMFGSHAYGRPVIGRAQTVSDLSRDALVRFWRRHYHPARALLAVAGPVEVADVLKAADRRSLDWPAGAPRKAISRAQPRTGGHEGLRRGFASVVVAMGWPIPGIGHADEAALDVLTFGLGEGAASRLGVLLDLEHRVASQVWADASHWLGAGMLSVGFVPRYTGSAIELANAELQRVSWHGLRRSEIDRAKRGISADLSFAIESTQGIASELAWSVARLGDPSALAAYRLAVAAVSPADVLRVAKRWLDPARRQLVVLDDRLRPSTLDKAASRGRRTPARIRRSKAVGKAEVHHVGSMRVAILPDDGPVAAVRVLVPGGQLWETTRNAGLSEAWARCVIRAAGPWDPPSLAAEADSLSLRLDAYAGRTTQSVGASFPAAELADALAMVGCVLADPHMAADDLDATREEMQDDHAALADDSHQAASEALWRGLWPDHPFRLATLGTPSTIERFTTKGLRAFHRTTIAADNVVVAVAGGVDPDVVLRAVAAWHDELPGEAGAPPSPTAGAPGRSPRKRVAGTGQAVVVLGARGVPIGHPDQLALRVATNLLDSQSGRLFLTLREEQGLAYSVWAQHEANRVGGVFSVGLATDPARVTTAVRGLRRELAALAQDGPDDEELQRTRRMILGLAAMRNQQVGARAAGLAQALLHRHDHSIATLATALDALSPQAIREALAGLDLANLLRVTVVPRP